jgi:uncharacterized protein (DUF58 family)
VNTSERRGALLFVATVTGIIAVAAANTGLLLWAVAIAVIAGGLAAWSRLAWKQVEVSARFRPARAFLSEQVSLQVRVTNGKPIPLPLVRLAVWLPEGVHPAGGRDYPMRGFQRRFSLSGRSVAEFNFPVTVRRRGEYWVEKVQVGITDPFDLAPLQRELPVETALIVMPEPRIEIPMSIRRRLPFGRPAQAVRLFEERERFAGVRPYEPGDSLNRIHWKLTGHAGRLQTKLFEPTRTAEVVLVLDLAAGEPFWDSIFPEIAEDTIGWATFLARQAIGSGWRVGMVANTHLRRGRGPLRVPIASVPGHEASVFAALARMPNEPTSDLAPVMREAGRRWGKGTTAVVISPRPGHWLRHEMAVLRRRGTDVVHLSPVAAVLG